MAVRQSWQAFWRTLGAVLRGPRQFAHDWVYLPERQAGRDLARRWPQRPGSHPATPLAPESANPTQHSSNPLEISSEPIEHFPNPLERYFDAHTDGPGIYKWRHYFEIYHRHLARFVNQPVTMLEIGIYSGGSLAMWRDYFGGRCRLHGLDCQPACQVYANEHTTIHIGDQGSRAFWQDFRRRVPVLDIVVDDGSHKPEHQIITLEELLPHLRPGGVFICEDVHGFQNRFAEYMHALANGLNEARLARDAQGLMGSSLSPFQQAIESIHFYPYLVVIETRRQPIARLTAPKQGTQWQPFMS